MNCSSGQYYNQATKNCNQMVNKSDNKAGTKIGSVTPSPLPSGNAGSPVQNPTSGTYSQCPPVTPFWSTSDLACYKCPDTSPSYNPNSNQC
jgi:hypothetical protein